MTEQFANQARGLLAANVGNLDTTITVASASSFPTSSPYRILIDSEIMLVTAGAGTTTWTVVRAREGTSATTHANGTAVIHSLTAGGLLKAANDYSWRPYPKFTLGPLDDEFDDNNFSGWIVLNNSTPTSVIVETNDVLSCAHPGNETNGPMFRGIIKDYTPNPNDFIETGIRIIGIADNYYMGGVVWSDADTVSGTQLGCVFSPAENLLLDHHPTAWHGSGTTDAWNLVNSNPGAMIFIRSVYLGSGSYCRYVSYDGIGWAPVGGNSTGPSSPVAVGLCFTTWQGSSTKVFTFDYFRQGNLS